MVPQGCGRTISFCLLFVLLNSVGVEAQPYQTPQAFVPFGSPTDLQYEAAPTYLVARGVSPPVSYESQPAVLMDGDFVQSGCDGIGCQPTPSYCCPPRRCAPWYASVAGLYLDRSEPRRVWTTYEDGANANQLMNTQDADPDWEPGADLRIGRFFACDSWAVELGYWSIDNFTASATQTHPSFVSSPLLFNDLVFIDGAIIVPVQDLFDNAAVHRITRENEIHNVELNLIQGNVPAFTYRRWTARVLAGVRYFKFDEDLIFESADAGGTLDGSGVDEARLVSSTQNDLIGGQIGCLLQRQIGCRTALMIAPKFGVYNNHIEHQFDLRRGDGIAATPTAAGITGSYPVEVSTDEVAFLAECNVGLQHQISCRCSLFGGYRVVTLNQIALADNQIPQYIVDIPEIADIDTDGSLVLHGAFFGATWCF